jgi:MFS family permease
LNYENPNFDPKIIQESIPLWKNKKAMLLLFQYAFLALVAGVFQSTFSLFGFIRFNLNAPIIGLFLSAIGLFQVIFRAFAFNRIRTKLGDPKTAMLGMGSYILAYFLLGFVINPWQLLFTVFFISFSGATSRGITIGFSSRSVDFRNQGKIMGLNTSLDNLSQILGPIIGGILLLMPNGLFYGLMLSIFSIIPFMVSFRVLKFGYDNRIIPTTRIQPVKVL